MTDADARRRILTEFGSTFFVEAAAGTGKTTALVGRIVGMVRAGAATLDRIVAVTFTEKAAGEMKLRLRSEIERARAEIAGEEKLRLDQALKELELTRIGTIHAFCSDLLRERPVEAGIDPLFEVASEEEAATIADDAFERWFQRALSDPPEGIRRVLRRRSGRQSPRDQLRSAMNGLREHRDFPTPWRRDPFDRDGQIDSLMSELSEVGKLAAESSWANDLLTDNLAEIGRFVGETIRLEAHRGRDYDGLEAELRDLARRKSWEKRGNPKTTFGALSRGEVLRRRDLAKTNLDAFIQASDADLAPLLHEALQVPIRDYQYLKSRSGRLDFLDLLIKARDLIRDNITVRNALQQHFTHFFVDEFQDTDPLQVEILLLLAVNDSGETDWRRCRPIPGKLFLVGDPKQSVYRFRRADVVLYEHVKKRLLEAGAELLHLTTSFRAPPSIQSFVNGAFGPAMPATPDGSQAAYVPLRPSRPEVEGRPTIVALPVPKPYGDYGKITKSKIDESFPDAVGAFIYWLVGKSGWTVDEDGRVVPIQPRHIAILFRRFRNYGADVTRSYVRALEARRIPHVLVGGRSFHDCEEVIALRNAFAAIEWPDDELRVFATLRGPFFALGDEALLVFRQGVEGRARHLNPMRPIERDTLDPSVVEVADALELLRRLHVGRNHRSIAQTIAMLMEALRAQAGMALWPTGERALANCQRMIDMARHFEKGASSFRAFVEKLEADAERGEAEEAPIFEEGTEGVRVMTLHKAKGLEFPVVILADPTCSAARDTPSRHVDPGRRLWLEPICGLTPIELLEAADEELRRDQAEAIRIAYVAATRARDLLVAPVCGDQEMKGWLEVLNPMLYPPNNLRGKSGPAPGCPAFGSESVLERGPDAVLPRDGSVKPGLHGLVVWWDPTRLELEIEEQAPLRHQQLLEAEATGESETSYVKWIETRQALLARAAQPSLSVQTVTSTARTGNGDDIQIEVVERNEAGRPGGRRFGSLIHAILADIDLDADDRQVRASAGINGRMFGATEGEIEAAIAVVTNALKHPILRRAEASGKKGGLRRETPVVLRLDDGSLVEGVIDLAFREGDSWTVVDFKTDREFEASSARYLTQVRLYSEAVRASTSQKVRSIVLVL
jgi:ATP-dependent exoDNAse (exonuclease V) beta subunit